jgi:hypothetical protein
MIRIRLSKRLLQFSSFSFEAGSLFVLALVLIKVDFCIKLLEWLRCEAGPWITSFLMQMPAH